MSVKMSLVDVAGEGSYPETPQVSVDYQAKTITVLNMAASGSIAVSFDGETDHGLLTPNTPSAGLIFTDQYVKQVWLREATAGATPLTAQVIVTA